MKSKVEISAKENKEQIEKTQCYKYHYGKFKPNGYIIEKKDGK
jgi:hypothetical protein